MANEPAPPALAELIDVWQESLETIIAVCTPLSGEQWQALTPCPGWTVADIVAHIIDLEQFFGEEPRPDHKPDWEALPHVIGDFGRFTEVGVDARRGRDPQELLAELQATIDRRRPQLEALPADEKVLGPTGTMVTLDRFLRVRIFDTWAHEQDIRWAIGDNGGWNSNAAGIAFLHMLNALPYVWSRNVKAPPGSTLRLTIIAPDLEHTVYVTVGEDGRGARIKNHDHPDVLADMTWAAYARLSCGRVATDDPWLADKVEITGDADLGARLLTALAITP